MKCSYHLCETALEGKQRRFCSNRCKTKFFVTKYRRNFKKALVEYKGGKCEVCGYDKSIAAMEFHHTDPNEKDFGIASKGNCMTLEAGKREVNKCQLLCANCHREIHANLNSTVE